MLIAMTGQKRSGKDTVAGIFEEEWGYEKIMFAGPLKGMIKFLLMCAGLTDEEAEARVNGSESDKEEALAILQGKSTRFAMQKLGTEWRNFFGENLWIDIIKSKVDATKLPIITDMRFVHEGDYVDELGGAKIRVRRAGQSASADLHPSEQEMEKIIVDYTIYNHGSLEDLKTVTSFVGMEILVGAPLHEQAALFNPSEKV